LFFFLTADTKTDQGKSVVVTVIDRCADCEIATNVDLSPVAFSVLADQSVGRLFNMKWEYTTEPPGPSAGPGVTARAENKTVPDLKARTDSKEGQSPPSSVVVAPGSSVDPHGKRSTPETKRANEKLKKRKEPEVPAAAAPGGGPALHGKRSFSESFKREDMQRRGRMVRRHRRSVAHQSVDEPVA